MDKNKRRSMIKQKVLGLLMIILCVVIVIVGIHGENDIDRDITPVVFLAPMGISLIFSKECWL